ncbi:MAG TPA: hypothetical protein VIS78_12685 [Blastocatellia bacterium]
MARNLLSDLPLWEQFEEAARQRRRNPVSLLSDFMREYLERLEDQKLDDEIKASVQRSGYHEDDAVNLVRRYRLEKKDKRATS